MARILPPANTDMWVVNLPCGRWYILGSMRLLPQIRMVAEIMGDRGWTKPIIRAAQRAVAREYFKHV